VRSFARNALQLNILLGICYSIFLWIFKEPLLSFFRLGDTKVISDALLYLNIVIPGLIFMFINPIFSGIYNGMGNSHTPFYVNSVGLIINMVLDPVLIYGLGPFNAMGVVGAGIGTVIAQFVVMMIYLILFFGKKAPIDKLHLWHLPEWQFVKTIFKFGSPVAVQSGLFTIFAMFLARIVAQWGAVPIAVQKVGAQIEAISWMTAGGFSTALSAFVGQNYGAKNWDRIWKGYFTTLGVGAAVGIFATILFVFAGGYLFRIFIPEAEALRMGTTYLKILGLSQLFMCLEITTSGAFNGLGRTLPPSLVSIILTGSRVPAAMLLATPELLGLNGVWWSISMSSVLKGIVLVIWFLILLSRRPEIDVNCMFKSLIYGWEHRNLRDKRCLNGKTL
ncbi:MAG: MATE family efflux transporter, partial [Candidatus Cloacimonetes bacterium]|nr:MATE family efflux transporter [Candidatus Cloacimonadota bacterium]